MTAIQLNNYSAGLPALAVTEEKRTGFKLRGLGQTLEHLSGQHEMVYQRFRRVRAAALESNRQGPLNAWDHTLALPEQFRNSGLRRLIRVSRYLEELGELSSDFSGVTERFTRNLMSDGKTAGIASMVAAGVGRLSVAYLSMFGFALHKAIGASLYLGSSALSALALGISNSRYGTRHGESRFQEKLSASGFDQCLYKKAAHKLAKTKRQLLEGYSQKHQQRLPSGLGKTIHRQLSGPQIALDNRAMAARRQANPVYMWANLHQYKRRTQVLMQSAHTLFHGVNKLLISYDKHAGALMGNGLARKGAGELFSQRLGMLAGTAIAAGLSVPLGSLYIGTSKLGAIACAASALLLCLAKADVLLFSTWKGDLRPPA